MHGCAERCVYIRRPTAPPTYSRGGKRWYIGKLHLPTTHARTQHAPMHRHLLAHCQTKERESKRNGHGSCCCHLHPSCRTHVRPHKSSACWSGTRRPYVRADDARAGILCRRSACVKFASVSTVWARRHCRSPAVWTYPLGLPLPCHRMTDALAHVFRRISSEQTVEYIQYIV